MGVKKYTSDNEENLMSDFRADVGLILIVTDSIFDTDEYSKIISVLNSISNELSWNLWKNNSANTNLPPDFHSEELKMMMEVMIVDDQGYKKGKINKTKAKEREMLGEVKRSGILQKIPNIQRIVLVADSGASTEENHSYNRYTENFNRIVGKHGSNSENYRNNFKDHLLVFFVFDETSGSYIETKTKMSNIEANKIIQGKPHYYMYDKVFLESIKKSGADYLVWHRPYNYTAGFPGQLPRTVVYDVNNMSIVIEEISIDYNKELMMKNEL